MSAATAKIHLVLPAGDAIPARPPDGDRHARELARLRSAALRNMRQLKAQILPAIDAASCGEGPLPASEQWLRLALGTIDAVTIAASGDEDGGGNQRVELGAAFRAVCAEIGDDDVTVGALPVLWARPAHMSLLAREIVTVAVRSTRAGRGAALEIARGSDADDCAIVWVWTTECTSIAEGVADWEPERLAAGQLASAPHAWSLCARLMDDMGGTLIYPKQGRRGFRLGMAFPAEMLAV